MSETSSSTTAPEKAAATSLFVRAARAMGMDRAIGYAVLARMWQLMTGPVTQVLLVMWLTDSARGFYYAFLNLLGLQIFIELGLHIVIINLSSHEWAGLTWDGRRIDGDVTSFARLSSLHRLFRSWYLIAGVVFVALAMSAGLLFFKSGRDLPVRSSQPPAAGTSENSVPDTAAPFESTASPVSVSWKAPWVVLVLLTGCQLPLLAWTSMLEGCNQLRTLNAMRFAQSVAGTVLVWVVLACGGGLWALVASAAIRFLGELWLTRKIYGPFFDQLDSVDAPPADWRREILPMQWRVAVQGILLWFVNSVPGLVVFHWHGAVAAGRLGMTWTILTALQSASMAWMETRRPQFGALIAERRFRELDQLFFASLKRAVIIMLTAGSAFVLAVWWFGTRDEWLCTRMAASLLPWRSTLLFTVAFVLLHFALGASLYIRAHKRDPFLVASVISGIVLASLEFWWGRQFGPEGVAVAYLLGVSCVQVPLWLIIWQSARREWHRPVEPQE